MQSAKPVRDGRRGNAMLEAALTLPVLLYSLFGILDVGVLLMRQQGFVERLRAAARFAVVEDYDATRIRNVVLYNDPDPVAPTGNGLLGLRPEMISVAIEDVGHEAAERITIEIEDYPVFLFTPGLAGTVTARPLRQSITRESFGGYTVRRQAGMQEGGAAAPPSSFFILRPRPRPRLRLRLRAWFSCAARAAL